MFTIVEINGSLDLHDRLKEMGAILLSTNVHNDHDVSKWLTPFGLLTIEDYDGKAFKLHQTNNIDF